METKEEKTLIVKAMFENITTKLDNGEGLKIEEKRALFTRGQIISIAGFRFIMSDIKKNRIMLKPLK